METDIEQLKNEGFKVTPHRAKGYHKPIILVLEPNVVKPPDFPSNIEYYRLMNKITLHELIKLSERIHETYKSGNYSKIVTTQHS